MAETKYKELVIQLLQASRLHRKLAERRAADMDIQPSQHRMLMYLSKTEVAPSQSEIAKRFEISPAAVSNTLKKLEKMGYVQKVSLSDDGDARVNEIKITEKGKKEADDTREYFSCIDKTMFQNFSDEELATLSALLKKACGNLSVTDEASQEDSTK